MGRSGRMTTGSETPHAVLQTMLTAQNERDLDALVACFAPDYTSEQPVHPGVSFSGRDQVQKNWASIFGGVADFQSELLRSATSGEAASGETVWAEWHWRGTRRDGTSFEMRGVTIFGVKNDKIAWAQLYMEPVQGPGTGIDAQVQARVQGGKA